MSRNDTLETWSRKISDPAVMPPAMACAIGESFTIFPYCVWTPAARGLFGTFPPSYLCLGEGKIALFRDEGAGISSDVARLQNIDQIEVGIELLHAWIAFWTQGRREVVFFNSVSEPYYQPFLEMFRDARESSFESSADVDDYLASMRTIDYKYFTYPRAVLGQRLSSASYYHPRTMVSRGFLAGRVITPYFIVAAAGMLYSFSEEKIFRSPRATNYSMVVRYIPVKEGLVAHAGERLARYTMARFEVHCRTLLELPVSNEQQGGMLAYWNSAGIAASDGSGERSNAWIP